MKQYLVDVPVLLLFFVRPDKTKQVFEQIKKARPSKLYLYQDGARENRPDDIENIMKCRKIVEDIDWDCTVYRKYCKKNIGCDPSGYISRKWLFENESYGIILEDDCVPSVSFFGFCEELLKKYQYEDRVQMICGYNPIDIYNRTQYDYFFSKVSSIWGWATWKRVVDTWDGKYTWMDNENLMNKVYAGFSSKKEREAFIQACYRHRNSGKEYFETINKSNMILYDRIAINPKYNMISNIGIGYDTTHAVSGLEYLPRYRRKLFYKKVYEYDFPLKHPKEIERDYQYEREVDKALGHRGLYRIVGRFQGLYAYTMAILKHKGLSAFVDLIKKKCKNRK